MSSTDILSSHSVKERRHIAQLNLVGCESLESIAPVILSLLQLFALWYFPRPMKFPTNPADPYSRAVILYFEIILTYFRTILPYFRIDSPLGGDFRVRNLCAAALRD
jgi:hypothetical protein